MAAIVVVESGWGNTAAVARAVAEGLGGDTVLVGVDEAPDRLPEDVDLLVVGGPTHAFSWSSASTRADATRQGAPAAEATPGIREWVSALPASEHLDVATFDTRVTTVRHLPGSAARRAAKEVRRRHLGRLVGTCSFYVQGVAGPLLDGELDRARRWGAGLAARSATASA
jgi:hypothetical protein